MRYATVTATGVDSTAAVQLDDEWRALPARDLSALLAAGPLADHHPGAGLTDVRPLSLLPRPAKVVCCGLNYADHITEMGRELPAHPTLFTKYADTLVGPDDPIVVPAGSRVDWEAELAVVIGKQLRGASRDDASAGIAGYTVANDISLRDWQNRTTEWLQGKAWDATTPVGPVLVTPDALDVAGGVAVTCRVDGELVQDGRTDQLVFDPADLVAYVSTFTVLRPGDLVLTGTPAGVGAGRTPPRFLADGQLVETAVEGIGTLHNRIVVTSNQGASSAV